MTLPTDAAARKATPVATGFLDNFPDAVVEVARCSYIGSQQHNPGQPIHWDRAKSGDESDALMRHFLERGTIDVDGIRHSAKMAWRAMALLQKELENDNHAAPVITDCMAGCDDECKADLPDHPNHNGASEGSFQRDVADLTGGNLPSDSYPEPMVMAEPEDSRYAPNCDSRCGCLTRRSSLPRAPKC